MPEFTNRLAGLAVAFETSEVAIAPQLKLKTAELILRLMKRKKRFGLFVILGWRHKWHDSLDISDSRQDIFAKHHIVISDTTFDARAAREVAATLDFDGAILIDNRGAIVHSGVMIEGLRPRAVAQKVNPGTFKDLSEQFGFNEKVHTRHLAAIAASYTFKGTTVFTVSEETGSFHAYEAGRIVYQQ